MQSCTVGPNNQLWVAYVQSFSSETQVPKQHRREKKEAEAMPVFWWDTAGFLRHAGTETRAISTTCEHPSLTLGMPFHNSQFYIYVSCMCVCCFLYNCMHVCMLLSVKLHVSSIMNIVVSCWLLQLRIYIASTENLDCLFIIFIMDCLFHPQPSLEWYLSEVFWYFWSFHCRPFISVPCYTSFSNFMSDSALLLHIR